MLNSRGAANDHRSWNAPGVAFGTRPAVRHVFLTNRIISSISFFIISIFRAFQDHLHAREIDAKVPCQTDRSSQIRFGEQAALAAPLRRSSRSYSLSVCGEPRESATALIIPWVHARARFFLKKITADRRG
jgi:hypothetical protein